jgi:hypothetical protein
MKKRSANAASWSSFFSEHDSVKPIVILKAVEEI